MIIVLIKLILAHLIGDFPLLPNRWVEAKEKKKILSWELYAHIAIHGLLALLLLGDFKYWAVALSIAFGHLLIDLTKVYLQIDPKKSTWFIIDQLMHFVVIIGIWAFWFESFEDIANALTSDAVIIYITAIFFLTQPMSIIMHESLKNWSVSIKKKKNNSLTNAGKYIGILERLFVFIFIATSNWEAVGFLLAAKSVFRFGDLRKSKDRKLTEYVLIGTLVSFGTSIIIALITIRLISN